MKKIFLLLLSAYTCLQAFAAAAPNEKVLNRFNNAYPAAENVTWSEDANFFVVYFKKGAEQFRLWYNKEGEVVQTIRYYDKEYLPPFIRSKVENKYKGWNIKYITELSSDVGTVYNVTVEKGKHWHSLMVNSYGQISVDKKYYTK